MHKESLNLALVLLFMALCEAVATQASELARVPGKAQCSESPDQAAYTKCLEAQARERSAIVHATEQRVLDAMDNWEKDTKERDRAIRLFKTSQMSFEGFRISMCEVSAISEARGPGAKALLNKCLEKFDLEWLDHLQELILEFRS